MRTRIQHNLRTLYTECCLCQGTGHSYNGGPCMACSGIGYWEAKR